ncbi:SusD/RagB family nutrient-binding outer membrane lipoprotein [Massilibacteroides sp.]|uniref:SusD/RagB family nutrient-binding outer membrane lipoprotein n=1 Tax=Massilibacteroides sp. TaxID=2034766 RepID=UPI0026203219|nr:SusD/RagB family nutrient-binding outer membrane lipoprotein [Massilibacteroides sp.]MDD4516114.1 SusD/RagB family nutrient-binding outer membrane lipoprotein [Massilibacteroides sp.]
MKSIIKKLCLFSFSSLMFVACTDSFEDMNKNSQTANEVSPSLLLPKMQDYGFNNNSWEYQVGPNLHTNLYSQYFANTATYFNSGRYGYNNAWVNDGYWKSYYTYLPKYLNIVKEQVKTRTDYTYMFQVMRIISAMGAIRTTDVFGDIPYTEGGIGINQPKYDTQKDIYYDVFNELGEAVDVLKSNMENQKAYGEEDLFFNGDYAKWIKLANSLRLRYALRISFIDPEKAKLEGEKALKEEMMISNADNAAVRNSTLDEGHCLFIISYWNEFRMSKTMEKILKETSTVEDPRMPIWFGQTIGWVNGESDIQFQGTPNGLSTSDLGLDEYKATNNSSVWGFYAYKQWNLNAKGSKSGTPSGIVEKPMMLMNYAEVCFLKAEAAIRGWSGAGSAAENYEAGIRASFEEGRAQVEDKSVIDTSKDDTYITTGFAKWDEAADFETRLKKIITQKWIAMYPNGDEAWSEFRRTGYPDLMPISQSEEPSINPENGEFIKKLRYVDDERRENKDNALSSDNNQGQGDGMNVRVWWDTKRYK